ncbi:CAMK family protein kinase [Histomonas meleagridis]|uniref:CAMK family protein kinase n=1 Tax=Histomonas meleagridis TaxID=135588 RepID=UPI00355A45F1|nr:CAMK family protein kinase [Histomonas meleagridis]KAH0797521.1 CAMK family protein kinase [Histomonas meleagridis]
MALQPILEKQKNPSPCNSVTKVLDYVIGEPIGKGVFSSIRSVFHTRSKKQYAAKIISKPKLLQCPMGKRILFNETILAPLLNHPCIIEIEEIADTDTQIFQFMRYAEHGDLLRKLRKSPFETSIAIRLIDQLFSAVEYIHGIGICHRDIKLENLLLSKNGLKLCDFGFASLTFNGKVHGNCGSYEYSAPEAIREQEFDGFKADMWSCGVVIYAFLSRRLPFTNVNRDFDFNTPVDYSPIPKDFRHLIQQLLSVDPTKRPNATVCRSYPALKSTQTRLKDPLSSLKIDRSIFSDQVLISRLTQATGIDLKTYQTKLNSEEMNREKLIFLLLKRQDRSWLSPRECPTILPTSSASDSPSKKGFFPLPTINNVAIVEKRMVFSETAANVYSVLHLVSIKQKCCISSPLSLSPTIVLKRSNGAEMRISFSIIDGPEPKKATLVLCADKSSEPLLVPLVKYMERHLK